MKAKDFGRHCASNPGLSPPPKKLDEKCKVLACFILYIFIVLQKESLAQVIMIIITAPNCHTLATSARNNELAMPNVNIAVLWRFMISGALLNCKTATAVVTR